MNTKEYVRLAKKTESNDFSKMKDRLVDEGTIRLLHAGIGLATESAEFQDALKKHIFYGKKMDLVNLGEELGDLMWYLAIAVDELGLDLSEVMETNIKKLKARYGEKFCEESAEYRDLEEERKILEERKA